ncbi:MAG: enoyl-CoA hydratase/isomerase family protein [Rhodospirillaceae bacterium]|nr:enoyl-CoA hydratase/isomerase family protein [Rhodospirillaceae bacterium]
MTRDGSIATIHFNQPAKRNAITIEMWRQMLHLVGAADRDPSVKAIVVTGEGGAFAAGSDIEEFGQVAQDPSTAPAAAEIIHQSEKKLHRVSKPTLAKISGACVGAGCGIALCCDFRFADTTARFGIPPARLGLVYSVADTKRLVDVVGAARARDMLFTGRILDSAEALSIGLVDRLVEPARFEDAVRAYAVMLADASPFSVRAMKGHVQMVLDGAKDDTPETRAAFADAISGPDFKEGHAAFMAKRKPVFPS